MPGPEKTVMMVQTPRRNGWIPSLPCVAREMENAQSAQSVGQVVNNGSVGGEDVGRVKIYPRGQERSR